MVPLYSGTPFIVLPLLGSFHSFLPVANPIKFFTASGALSGNRVQVMLPAVVSIIAVALLVVVSGNGVLTAEPDALFTDGVIDDPTWLVIGGALSREAPTEGTLARTKSPYACPEFRIMLYCGSWSERPPTPG